MVTKILVNIGLGNDLLLDGTKPFPKPMLTSHWGPVVTTLYAVLDENHTIKNHIHISQWTMS